jgi:hypothetical protein
LSLVTFVEVVSEDEHIADANAVLEYRLAVIPEIVLSHVVYAKAAPLIKSDVIDA